MKLKIAKNHIQNLIAKRNGYLMLASVSMLGNIVLIVALIVALRSEKIILVPPTIERPMWITSSQVSADYLSSMSIFLSTLLLNVNASNAELQHQIFLRYVDGKQYQHIKTNLKLEEEKLKKKHLAINFHLTAIKVDASRMIAHVIGDLEVMLGEEKIPNKRMTYQLKYNYQSGLLKLLSFEELKST